MLKLIKVSIVEIIKHFTTAIIITLNEKEKQNKDKPKLERRQEVLSRLLKKKTKKKNGVSGTYGTISKCLTDMSGQKKSKGKMVQRYLQVW